MDAIDLEKFNDAVALAQAGKKQEAHQRLKALYLKYKQEVNLLLWLAYTADDQMEAKQFIDLAIKLDGSSAAVESAKSWFDRTFRGQQAPGVQTPPAPQASTNYYQPYNPFDTHVQNKPKSDKIRFWLIFAACIAIIIGLVGSINDGSIQGFVSNLNPTYYSNPKTMRDKASIGETAKFTGVLYHSIDPKYNDVKENVWDIWAENSYQVSGVLIKFPVSGKLNGYLGGVATYTVRVIGRDNLYLITEIVDVN